MNGAAASAAPVTPRPGHAAWRQKLVADPWRFDFYAVLRRFESDHPHLPRLGEAVRPVDEPLRMGQSAEMDFAPAPLQQMRERAEGPPILVQRIVGLLGPNGALPLHLTELTRERERHHADPTLRRFLDLLTHRLTLLFYRAWAQAQPVLSLDRPGDTQFLRRIGSLTGIGMPSLVARDAVGDGSKLFFTGRLGRQVHDAEGLLAWCRQQFDVPVQVLPWCGHWMPLDKAERSRLAGPSVGRSSSARGRATAAGNTLGGGAVLGASVWDVQHKFRIVIGPLPLLRYEAFLPGGADVARLQAIVRQWVGIELAWDLKLILKRNEVPRLQLGRGPARLGRTSWLGHYRKPHDAGDLTLDVERTVTSRKHPSGPRRRAS